MKKLLTLAIILATATPAFAVQANISWVNPSDPSVTSIQVEKAAVPGGPFTAVGAPLAPTATSATDTIPLSAQVCYRVIWRNTLGASAPLGPACGTPNPAATGSGLTIIFQP